MTTEPIATDNRQTHSPTEQGGGSPPPESVSRRHRRAIAGAAIVVLAAAGVIVDATLSGGSAGTVVTAVAAPGVIHAEPGGNGQLSAAPSSRTTISLDLPGITTPVTVTQVFVTEGSQVKPGDPLVAFDPAPIRARAVQLGLALAQAQGELQAAEQAQAQAPTYSARALDAVRVQQLQGTVALDQQLTSTATGNTATITAPVAGTVSSGVVDAGTAVRPGATLLSIVDPSQVLIDTSVTLADLQTVHPGQGATLTIPALPGVQLRGKVVGVSPLATNHGLSGTVIVQATNIPGSPAPIGTVALVTIDATTQAAVSVPRLAVRDMDLAPAVYVVTDGHVRLQPVTVGVSDLSRVQILNGLRPGQDVVVSATQALQSGDTVRVAGTRR